MKRYKLLLMLCGGILFWGCERYLDMAPDRGVKKEEVFADFYSSRSYLDVCYRSLEDYLNAEQQGDAFNWPQAMADEATCNYKSSPTRKVFNAGNWLDRSDVLDVGFSETGVRGMNGYQIPNAFFCIRIANEVLEEVAKMGNLTEAQRNQLNGQAYFMRAWYYFQIIKRWGGMPLLDRVIEGTDDYDLHRLTYHQSSEWLISDLNAAIGLLPDNWPDADAGRATKASAMAVKSMAQLYDASPGMCPELGYQYDTERCKLAAKYAHELIEYINDGTKGHSYRLMPGATPREYASIFYTNEDRLISDEHLWFRNNGTSRSGERNNEKSTQILWQNATMNNATGFWGAMYIGPTQNIVDMFEVSRDGTAYDINDPDSEFTMGSEYFKDRDPRLYNTMIYSGSPAFGKIKGGQDFYLRFWNASPAVKEAIGVDLQQHNTLNPIKDQMGTGYMCKKWMWPEAVRSSPNKNTSLYNYNSVYIRVAQVYLDYAEAMNEAYGPNSDPEGYGLTAVEAVNIVRRRVGWYDVNSSYTANADDFRERIRNERAVELLLENHRWWDLRRWRISEEVFKKPIQGLTAVITNKNGSQKPSDWTFNYSRRNLASEQRVFSRKHYWNPIPTKYQEEFVNFNQNEGW